LPGASLPEEAFEEMYNHFGFGYETFHTLDVDGKVWLLFLEEDPDQCQLQLNARWEVTCAPWHTMGVLLTINIFDDLEEPLEVDYHFDLDSVDEAHEAVQLVDQATIPVCIVTPGEDDLQLFGSREITLPPALKDDLVELITAGLRRRQLDDEAEDDEEGDEDGEVS